MACESIVAKNVRSIIEASGYKQCAIAHKAGYEPNVFSNMLCGRKLITATDIPRLASALGVDCNALFARDDELK